MPRPQPRTFTIAAQHTTVPGVAAAEHFTDHRAGTATGTVAFLVQHGLGQVGVERLLVEVHRLQALLLQLHQQQVEDGLDFARMLQERSLAGIEHRQQRLGHLARGALHVVGLLHAGATAIVVEVGLQAQRDVFERVALRQYRLDVELERAFGLGKIGRIGGGHRIGGERTETDHLRGEIVVEHDLFRREGRRGVGSGVVAHRNVTSPIRRRRFRHR